ncbi:MAG: NAD-dependent epimerase/dehydratase family protein [Chloroflexi bacterium]|nr:NAD-dependent epimerase/dehydratase family protein [Chloroflexota bacterium]
MNRKKILVTGAGGLIGHHLVEFLKERGYWVRGVDIRKPLFSTSTADDYQLLDLREYQNCQAAMKNDIDAVYALAADMGGMGYIAYNQSQILQNNLLININTIKAAVNHGVEKYFFSSSACVYPEFKQDRSDVTALKESDVFPAQPQDAYGWEKLTSEQIVLTNHEEHNIKTYIARFHNIYGPECTWEGGKEKAPAAICRKVATAKLNGNPEIEIWGDGEQTRSFCYIDDCLMGIYKLMESNHHEPINIGSDQLVSINQLVDLAAEIGCTNIIKNYISGPEGVRGRNSDNTLIKEYLDWAPSTGLEEGLSKTYAWIEKQVQHKLESEGIN